MFRNHALGFAVVGLLLLAIAASALTPVVAVEAKCPPGRPNQVSSHPFGLFYLGWQAGQINYISSVITDMSNYSPWVAAVTPPPPGLNSSFVASVVSLNDYNSSTRTYNDWAEIGWVEYPYDVRYTMVQYTYYIGSGHYVSQREYARETTPYTHFETKFNPSTTKFEFWAAGVKKTETAAIFLPFYASQVGIMTTLANQMPGATNAPEWYLNSYYSENGTSHLFGFGGQPFNYDASYSPTFHFAYADANNPHISATIWDSVCSQ